MNNNNFVWAQGNEANLAEPIRELAEKGWRHRDIPKASNMNWVFKRISDDLAAIRKDAELAGSQAVELRQKVVEQGVSIQKQKELSSAELAAIRKDVGAQAAEFRQKLAEQGVIIQEQSKSIKEQGASIKEQKESIGALKAELKSLDKRHVKLVSYTEDTFALAFKRDDHNVGMSKAICIVLRDLVKSIKFFQPNFPELRWPLSDEDWTRAEDESGGEAPPST